MRGLQRVEVEGFGAPSLVAVVVSEIEADVGFAAVVKVEVRDELGRDGVAVEFTGSCCEGGGFRGDLLG